MFIFVYSNGLVLHYSQKKLLETESLEQFEFRDFGYTVLTWNFEFNKHFSGLRKCFPVTGSGVNVMYISADERSHFIILCGYTTV